MRRIDRSVLALLVVLALAVTGCSSQVQPAGEPTTAPTTVPAATSTEPAATATATVPAEAESPLPPPTTAGDAESPLPVPVETVTATAGMEMATLRDEFAGFAIDYPTGWTVLEPSLEIRQKAAVYSFTLQSWPPEEPGTQGIPEGGSKMDISVSKSTAAMLDEVLADYRTELTQTEMPVEVVSEEPRELASGLSGAAFEIKNAQGDVFYNFVTVIGDHRILLSSRGDRAIFDAMVQTLRPLPASGTP